MLFKLLNCVWQQTFSQEKANKLEGNFLKMTLKVITIHYLTKKFVLFLSSRYPVRM